MPGLHDMYFVQLIHPGKLNFKVKTICDLILSFILVKTKQGGITGTVNFMALIFIEHVTTQPTEANDTEYFLNMIFALIITITISLNLIGALTA